MHRIALLTGGSTPERDVALAGAAQVVKALRALGHEVTVVDTVSGPLTLAAEETLLAQDVRREPPTPERLAEALATWGPATPAEPGNESHRSSANDRSRRGRIPRPCGCRD